MLYDSLLRAITFRSDNSSDVSRAINTRSDSIYHMAIKITFRSDKGSGVSKGIKLIKATTFLHSNEAFCNNAKI
jgi:hypothetical protein